MNMRFIDYYHVAIFNIYYKLWENEFLFFIVLIWAYAEAASVTHTDPQAVRFCSSNGWVLFGTYIIVLIAIAIEYLQRVINQKLPLIIQLPSSNYIQIPLSRTTIRQMSCPSSIPWIFIKDMNTTKNIWIFTTRMATMNCIILLK